MNYIQVLSVSEVKTAKNGRLFQTVIFKELAKQINLGGRMVDVKSNNSTRTRNIWGAGVTPDGVEIKAEALFQNLKAGDVVEGGFHTVATTDYLIGDRTVNTYSCVVFSNENVNSYANRQLKQSEATVVNTEAAVFAPTEEAKAF